jgi:CYTH domain-containing protein
MLEKERKFLFLSENFSHFEYGLKRDNIIQFYLDSNKRIRVYINDDYDIYELTSKVYMNETDRHETNERITKEQAYELCMSLCTKVIYKTRYSGNLRNIHIDIDLYPNNISVIEVEYENEKDLRNLPYYFGKEVTNDVNYSNFNMALDIDKTDIIEIFNTLK